MWGTFKLGGVFFFEWNISKQKSQTQQKDPSGSHAAQSWMLMAVQVYTEQKNVPDSNWIGLLKLDICFQSQLSSYNKDRKIRAFKRGSVAM